MPLAVVVNQTPQAYQPAYNQQIFQATSSNYSQPNHTYTVIITDLISGVTQTREIPADPVYFSMYFDAMPFSKERIEHYMPLNGLTGFQLAVNGIRKIRVNIGETFGAGTPTYYAGSNFDYIIWNGVSDLLPFGIYNYTDYVYNNGTTNYKYFSGILNDLTFQDRSNFIYCLSTGAGDLTQLLIITYDASGSPLGLSYIANPFAASGTYTNKYVAIDVGYKGLNNISAGLVTGVYPIITANVSRYDVFDNTPGSPRIIKHVTIGCDCRYVVKTVHYLAKNGAFLTCNFNLISEKRITKTGQIYKRNPNTRAATSYGYSPNDAIDFDMNVQTQTIIILRTDWLTDEQVTQYKECLSSPKCFLDEGNTRSIRIRPVTGEYSDLPHYSQQLFQLTMEYYYSHQDHRQDV